MSAPGFEPDVELAFGSPATGAGGPAAAIGTPAVTVSPGPAFPPAVTVTAAAILLAFFLWMAIEMFGPRIGATDKDWARALSIYAGIEAFALAAAGVLLGTTIQAGRVRAAEGRAESKEKEATQAKAGKAAAEQDRARLRQAIESTRAILSDDGGERIAEHGLLRENVGPEAARIAAARRQIDSVLGR